MHTYSLAALVTPGDIYDTIVGVLTHEVTISAGGGLQISIASLIAAIVLFVVMYYLSRTAQRVLHRRVLSHLPIDVGLSYTLQRLVHYAIISLGVIFALRIGVGVDFTSFAVILTALSVGIGLGLKEIAGDVAAGFILLFERPVRVGDRVRLAGSLQVEGNVTAIDLRTTKIITNDHLTVIVPNSKLTNEQYVNWSYLNDAVRLHVPIGVAYGSDVGTVRDALLAAAADVVGVDEDKRPSVRLLNFGESTLDFELLVWTRQPGMHPQIRSDINFNIEREFREAGIEIPFPQHEVRVRSLPPELARSGVFGEED